MTRSWEWSAPRLRTAEAEAGERHATWLELVYDLVYVVAVAQLAHQLAEHPDRRGVIQFTALFVPIWWAWTGQTFYANRFDADDLSARLLAALQMAGVALLASSIPHALDSASTAFALAYAWIRAVLIVQYVRAWRHVPAARPLTSRYVTGFSMGCALWIVSVALPTPLRFALWGVALAIEIATPLLSRRYQASLPPQSAHLPERFGLFTIIVLGEGVVSLVAGLEHSGLAPASIITALAGMAVILGWWWVYFDNVENTVVLRTAVAGQVWVYGHLPLLVSLTGMAVGMEHLIVAESVTQEHVSRWLTCVAFAATALALAILHSAQGDARKAMVRAGTAAASLALAVLGQAMPPAAIALALAVIAGTQVAIDVGRARRSGPPAVAVGSSGP